LKSSQSKDTKSFKKSQVLHSKFASLFDSSLKQILPFVGKDIQIDNKLSVDDLHIQYIDPKKTITEMGYSLIGRGYIPDKRKTKK